MNRPARQRRRAAGEREAQRQRIEYLEALCVSLGASPEQVAGVVEMYGMEIKLDFGVAPGDVEFHNADGEIVGYMRGVL
jgi:hypothetical protein